MSGATIRETRGADGWREIAINGEGGDLIAVVTRPCSGAKWFLHRAGKSHCQRERFATRKAAIEAATADIR